MSNIMILHLLKKYVYMCVHRDMCMCVYVCVCVRVFVCVFVMTYPYIYTFISLNCSIETF